MSGRTRALRRSKPVEQTTQASAKSSNDTDGCQQGISSDNHDSLDSTLSTRAREINLLLTEGINIYSI